ncbi:MAG TPA: alpha/beta hydrolase [Xanthobacteraceae bacterium]|nr:alpha/beta hydrolase [Xanthobacteraceae bacterium]
MACFFRRRMHRRIKLSHSIAYAAHSRHRLDICRPAGAAAAPVVVFFYGGAWRSGNKKLYRYVAKALARRGYVAVVPDYRIYPEVRYPEFLDDGAQVVRWVKDNIAGFGGDPDKIFLKGHSAGAHIAAMLSLDARWLRKVGLEPGRAIAGLIGLAGPYDYMPLRDETLKIIFGGADRPDTQPIFHVAPGAPPALLITGGRDRLVEPGNSVRLAARLVAAGNAATVKTYRRVGHYIIVAAIAPVLREFVPVLRDVDAFIAVTLAQARSRQAAVTLVPA